MSLAAGCCCRENLLQEGIPTGAWDRSLFSIYTTLSSTLGKGRRQVSVSLHLLVHTKYPSRDTKTPSADTLQSSTRQTNFLELQETNPGQYHSHQPRPRLFPTVSACTAPTPGLLGCCAGPWLEQHLTGAQPDTDAGRVMIYVTVPCSTFLPRIAREM